MLVATCYIFSVKVFQDEYEFCIRKNPRVEFLENFSEFRERAFMANAIKYEDYEMSMEAVKAYLSYTRTKIAELTERITVLEEELEKAIEKDEPDPVYFATYSSDDESLNFYGVKGTIPEVGDVYDGKKVDNIYI